jgi:formylglycine-generating enzyme required for sulfatase activity
MKPFCVLLVFAGSATLRESPGVLAACDKKRSLHFLAAILGMTLISFSVFGGELPIDNASTEGQARDFLGKVTREQPWQNSLGMKFVPVSGSQALFSIWDTRVEDFRAFVDSAGYDATDGMWSLGNDGWKQRGGSWKDPGFKQGSTDPVVGVSWEDAKAFCDWLTKRERSSGGLPDGMEYRLPTDQEWSIAVGLDSEPGDTPQEKSSRIRVYVWGSTWPPPPGSGNFCGMESRIGNEPSKWKVIEGYNDGYPRTSPVGSFAPNKNGLYDMAGNAWQWCEDWYNSENTHRVLRGASWDSHNQVFLLASCRDYVTPDYRGAFIGFRCVLAKESSRQAIANQ